MVFYTIMNHYFTRKKWVHLCNIREVNNHLCSYSQIHRIEYLNPIQAISIDIFSNSDRKLFMYNGFH